MEATSGFFQILTSETWDSKRTQEWMREIWLPTSLRVTVAYLLLIYVGIKWMRKRDAFQLDAPLAVWNLALAIFSLCGVVRLLPEFIWAVRNLGIVGTYCENAEIYTDPYTGYWIWLFIMSKAPELFDTMFLVLRKRPVTFLHWYHHSVMFLNSTLCYSEHQAWGRWVAMMNFTVHTVMYSYFFLRSIKVQMPAVVAKIVTSIQIVQMLISSVIFIHLFYIGLTGSIANCATNLRVSTISGFVSLSYLYIFAQFYYLSYVKKNVATHKKD